MCGTCPQMPETLTSTLGQPDDSPIKQAYFHRTSFDATQLPNEYSHSKSSSTDGSGATILTPDSSITRQLSASIQGSSTGFSFGAASTNCVLACTDDDQSFRSKLASKSPAKLVSVPKIPPPAATPTCTCLPGLVTLLCQLEDLRQPPSPRYASAQHDHHQHSTTPFSLKCILRGVQLAEEPWARLTRCLNTSSKRHAVQNPAEQDDDANGHHKQALILYGMSIRILLLSIHKFRNTIGINGQQRQQQHITENSTGASNETTASTTISHRHQRSQRGCGQQVIPSFVDRADDIEAADPLVSVGGVQLAGDTKAEIIKIAVRQALRQTTAALMRLLERTSRPSPASSLPSASALAATAFPMAEYSGHGNCEMMMGTPPLQNLSHSSLKTRASTHTNAVPGQDEKGESVAGLLGILQNTMKHLRDGEGL